MSYEAKLHARPRPVHSDAPTGLHVLQLGSTRNGFFYVPPSYNVHHPAPLVLLLHGAGGHAQHGLDMLRHLADDSGIILVAPASSSYTWDVIVDQAYGTDVALVNQAIEQVFNHYAVEPSRLAIGGFSDGASYALSLGLANGGLFTHIIAFSPGFVAPTQPQGKPAIFISHGNRDDVLPIGPCSRTIVPRLKRAGYAVTYKEFDGTHTIPGDIAQNAVDWFLSTT